MKRGKKYLESAGKYDKLERYSVDKGVELVKELAYAKFDESIEVSLKLNLKKSQTVRDTLVLPNQFVEGKKILVFAKGEKADEAREAGADFVGDTDMVTKIQEGWLDFDVAVATPDMMRDVGRLGPILGRRGLMPNPKTQTVTFEIKEAVEEVKRGRTEFRSDKTNIVHCAIGRVSMEPAKIAENINLVISEVNRKRPPDAKGSFVNSVAISSTMGPGVRLDVQDIVS
ncbi:MAG: 50S ribosomal protein L1 [Spirochaetales bacterium]|jgi:large subunit ribosomal protein L1|nr:50S ribosomal protein L1 [Spirochaetales bacterium]